MGRDFFEGFAVARDAYHEASDALDVDLCAVCFEDDPRLGRTEFTQPAILVTEVAMLRVLEGELGLTPSSYGGHSLGEYTALCAAGAIPLDVAARIVRRRGALMQAAVPEGEGAMVAVIAPDIIERDVTGGLDDLGVDVANRNSTDQVVLSGPARAIERAVARVRERLDGVDHDIVHLNVSAPFHSRAMHAIDAELERTLVDALPHMRPERATRVTSNLTGTFHDGRAMTLVDALVGQASGPVDWVANMHALAASATTIYEVGPHRPLRGFFRTVGRDVISVISAKGIARERCA
jgi:[acyl-carrier-protein] S-malonyltransferase/trans-AT polyketide synthase/acyltransferase/oxidoreductase domain-containing protein